MINTEQRKNQNDITLSNPREASHKVLEIGQLRRAKMHMSCFIEDIDNKNILNPSQYELLETSLILQTTSTKVLAAHLRRSPATIRAEFQQILSILGDYGKCSALRATEGEDFLRS